MPMLKPTIMLRRKSATMLRTHHYGSNRMKLLEAVEVLLPQVMMTQVMVIVTAMRMKQMRESWMKVKVTQIKKYLPWMIYTESNNEKFVIKLTRKAVPCEMAWWIDIGGGKESCALF